MKGFDPDLFLTAQNRVWPEVLRELRAGQKTSHWMWFVFPQLAALGRSSTARLYGLADLDAARAYLAHPVLGARLEETAALMLKHSGTPADHILGPVDALKLRSSMTLFSQVPGSPAVFNQVLGAFYDGQPCPLTLGHLSA